eukprot:11069092-Alexandrium_andersonii.AAC.1
MGPTHPSIDPSDAESVDEMGRGAFQRRFSGGWVWGAERPPRGRLMITISIGIVPLWGPHG